MSFLKTIFSLFSIWYFFLDSVLFLFIYLLLDLSIGQCSMLLVYISEHATFVVSVI